MNGDPEPTVQGPPRRSLDAIDVLKAYAIFGVLWQHAVPPAVTGDLMGNLWIRPAVPIFFVLVGFNLAGSLARSHRCEPRPVRSYLRRRVERIAVPFLLILAAAYIIALARGTFRPTAALLIGGLPVNAPGSYFVPALIGVTVMMPAIFAAYRRRPVATLVGCIAINVAFEAIASWSTSRGSTLLDLGALPYQGSPLRYLALVAFGVWLWTDRRLTARRNLAVLLLAVPSAAYLVLDQLRPDSVPFFAAGFLRITNYVAAPWAVLLVMCGLRWLPADASGTRVGRSLVRLGRASYHIYLVQMLWMGVAVAYIWGDLALDTWTGVAIAPSSML